MTPDLKDSIIRIPVTDFDDLISKMQEIMAEIQSTDLIRDEIPSPKNNIYAASATDNRDPRYWDNSFTRECESGLKLRPVRISGLLFVKFLSPRDSYENWMGVVITVKIGILNQLILLLYHYFKEIQQEECYRLTGKLLPLK